MDNPFDVNPYIHIAQRIKDSQERTKAVEAENAALHDEFAKVFFPDKERFETLKSQAKQALIQKKPQAETDKIYLDMAMIYKRWLPIEAFLLERNPLYRELFAGLKFMIDDIEKRKEKNDQSPSLSGSKPKRKTKKSVSTGSKQARTSKKV